MRIEAAKERMDSVDKRLEWIGNEMEFYKAGKKGGRNENVRPPHSLLAEQERAQKERATLAKNITDSEKEIEMVRARYDSDHKRYAELKGGQGALTPATERIPTPR